MKDTPSSYLHVSRERSLYARYNFIFTIAFIHLYGDRIVLQCKRLVLSATIITIAIILYRIVLSFVVSHYENYKYAQHTEGFKRDTATQNVIVALYFVYNHV